MNNDWLIWSNEHNAWWYPARAGYTQNAAAAGRYSLVDAFGICCQATYPAGSWNAGNGVPNEVMVPSPELIERQLKTIRRKRGEQ